MASSSAPKTGGAVASSSDSDLMNACTLFKNTYSTMLLLFCIVIVMVLIVQDDTALSQDVHSSFAMIGCWLALIWLSMVEGGQGAVVGLGPLSKDLYKKSHPMTYDIMELAHKGDNLDRYVIGRQFLTVLLVFIINFCAAPVNADEVLVFGMPEIMQEIFVRSGLAVILMTVMVGQLHSQVNGIRCMLDYINNRFMMFTLRVSLVLEASGTMHAVYVLQLWFAQASGAPLESKEPPRTGWSSVFFWARVVFSAALLGFCFAVTLTALFQNQTNMWEGIPASVSVVMFFGFMIMLGILEGTQIAVFTVSRLPLEEQAKHPPPVKKALWILFRNDGKNVARFMIGRQIIVTLLVFVLARVTTISVDVDAGEETIWGVPTGVQEFFNTGLLGAVITTIVGSISWKLIGSSFPVFFLSNPLVYFLIHCSLWLEASGVCAGAWVLAFVHQKVAHFQPDEAYVGTPEERAAKAEPDSIVDLLDVSSLKASFREITPQVGSSRYLHVDELSRASQANDSNIPYASDDAPTKKDSYDDDDEDTSQRYLPNELHLRLEAGDDIEVDLDDVQEDPSVLGSQGNVDDSFRSDS